MAKALMIQGTGSGAGKSLIAAALCRIFSDMGIKVAPFKAQNMALNSYITREGGEIGRAQALQAEACGVDPSVDMNPVLLKASGEMGCQVILRGKVHSMMKAREYYSFREEAWKTVKASFAKLSKEYELIVIEGAGSPAEINLMDVDIVNMSVARHAKAPVLLVGDIDKGGVFASLYGTVKLLGRDKRYIKGFIINKFRGDAGILRPGLDMITARTGIRVAGVLPYIHDLRLPEEDGLSLPFRQSDRFEPLKRIKIVVVRLRYISNFTDFDPLVHEPDVELVYSRNSADIENSDVVIIPGTKNTVSDLLLLKEQGLDLAIRRAFEKGIPIVGVCGGYQMLGRKILDPDTIESDHPVIDGIGLLDIRTTFGTEKVTCRLEAEMTDSGNWGAGIDLNNPQAQSAAPVLKGYEIHMGESMGDIGLFKLKRFSSAGSGLGSRTVLDGSKYKNCWGTYIHGLFENDLFRRGLINQVRLQKGLPPLEPLCSYSGLKAREIGRLAELVRANTDMDFVRGIAGI